MDDELVIVVHDKEQAVAALRAAGAHQSEILLLSARHASSTIGALVFKAIVDQAADDAPGTRFRCALDCGANAGRALSALRVGFRTIVFDPASPAAPRIVDIAGQYGAKVLDSTVYDEPLLDLETVGDLASACDRFIQKAAVSETRSWRQ